MLTSRLHEVERAAFDEARPQERSLAIAHSACCISWSHPPLMIHLVAHHCPVLVCQLHAESKESGIAPAGCMPTGEGALCLCLRSGDAQQALVWQAELWVKGPHDRVQAALAGAAALSIAQLGTFASCIVQRAPHITGLWSACLMPGGDGY